MLSFVKILVFSLSILLFRYVDVFDILSKFEDLDDIPAPLRFHQPNVTIEASLPDNITTDPILGIVVPIFVPFLSIHEYWKVLKDSEYALLMAGKQSRCPEPAWNSNVDERNPGVVRTIRFPAKEITKFRVFETEGDKVKMLMHATFEDYETIGYNLTVDPTSNFTEWNDTLKAINEGSVYNVSFRTVIKPDDTTITCPTTEMFPVPRDWCDHAQILFSGSLIQATIVNTTSQCLIEFKEQIRHYLDIWRSKETPKTTGQRCVVPDKMDLDYATEYLGTELATMYPYPGYFKCHADHNGANSKVPPCFDERLNKISYKENGEATLKSMVVGRGDFVEINMTMEFSKWTGDFATYTTQTFRDCAYNIPNTYLEMTIYIKDIIIPPEFGIPSWIVPFGIVIAVAFGVLLIACIYLAIFRTKKGFNIELWRFHRAQKDRELKKKMDERKQKSPSKQEYINGAYEEF